MINFIFLYSIQAILKLIIENCEVPQSAAQEATYSLGQREKQYVSQLVCQSEKQEISHSDIHLVRQ